MAWAVRLAVWVAVGLVVVVVVVASLAVTPTLFTRTHSPQHPLPVIAPQQAKPSLCTTLFLVACNSSSSSSSSNNNRSSSKAGKRLKKSTYD